MIAAAAAAAAAIIIMVILELFLFIINRNWYRKIDLYFSSTTFVFIFPKQC